MLHRQKALVSAAAIWLQTFAFGYTSEFLSQRLRFRIFSRILQQDIEYFDLDENSTGALTTEISDKPQKVNAACGQSFYVLQHHILADELTM